VVWVGQLLLQNIFILVLLLVLLRFLDFIGEVDSQIKFGSRIFERDLLLLLEDIAAIRLINDNIEVAREPPPRLSVRLNLALALGN